MRSADAGEVQILNGLLLSGFIIEAVEEAHPSDDMMGLPEMKDEMRRPMMLLVKAAKPGKPEKPPQPDASRQL